MDMSWDWTPLCQIGNNRYRITSTGEQSSHSSVVLPNSNSQCGILPPPQLPSDTTIVLASQNASQLANESSQPNSSLTVRPSVSSGYRTSHVSASSGSVHATPEERSVRRSPRLAQSSRVSYRDEGESQGRRNQSQAHIQGLWNRPSAVQGPTMWNANRNQSASNLQSNGNFSVYNYDGQIINTNSVSIIYNNNKNIANVRHRYPPAVPFAKPTSHPLNNYKGPPRKVVIKSLDFYEVVTNLLEEEMLLEGIGPTQRTFSFFLKQPDVKNLLDKKRKYPYLIQLRFCKLDGSCEQNDYYPATHQVAVNHQLVLLPGLETMPRGSMRPMDITHLCQINAHSCNFVTVRCLEACKAYVNIVQKYTSQDLLSRLEERNRIKEEDTIAEIKKKLRVDQSDEGIAASTLQFSLHCPLSRIRIKLPCRASTCTHLQCFDAATYLQMNECKPKWSCPVCYQPALYKNLQIDRYFKKIIDENTDTEKIELQPDGTWTLVDGAKKKSHQFTESVSEKKDTDHNSTDPADKTVTLDSDDDPPVENTSTPSALSLQANTNATSSVPQRRSDSPEVVTLSDDDDDAPPCGGESPQVTASTYPTFSSTPVGATTSVVGSNNIGLDQHLGYISDLLGGALNRQLNNSNYLGFHPLEHSNNLYIPLTRLPVSQLPSGLTITRKSDENRSSSKDRSRRNSGHRRDLNEKLGTSKSRSRSKKKKVRKVHMKPSKKSRSDDGLARRKRRRIVSASSDSSDSSPDTRKKSRKRSTKRKPERKRRASDSTDSEKSSAVSSSTKSSQSSVNLISSSNNSNSSTKKKRSRRNCSCTSSCSCQSSSSSSSSSDSPENDDSDQSEVSFTLDACTSTQLGTSRVLRSANSRQKRK